MNAFGTYGEAFEHSAKLLAKVYSPLTRLCFICFVRKGVVKFSIGYLIEALKRRCLGVGIVWSILHSEQTNAAERA